MQFKKGLTIVYYFSLSMDDLSVIEIWQPYTLVFKKEIQLLYKNILYFIIKVDYYIHNHAFSKTK